MREIKVLGPGCKNCTQLEQAVRNVVAAKGLQAQISKVTDYTEIAAHGVMSTPGLMIDGQVVSIGRVLSEAEIAELLD